MTFIRRCVNEDMKKFRPIHLMASLTLLSSLALIPACAAPYHHQGSTPAAPQLNWIGQELRVVSPSFENNPNITFNVDGTVNGFSGCNRFFGAYSYNENGLSIGNIGSTRMACSQGNVMQSETAFLERLTQARNATTQAGSVILRNSQGQTLFVLAP